MTKLLDKEKARLLKAFGESLLRDAIASGRIDPAGKSPEELRAAFGEFLREWNAIGGPIYVTLDHRRDLLSEARRMHRGGRVLFAVLLYATWLEHWLNDVILKRATARRIAGKEIVAMLRETTIAAKTGWLFTLLQLPRLSPGHTKAVLRLAELRNGFVHYKSTAFEMDTENPMMRDCKTALASLEKTIDYLHRYERRNLYRGRKPKLSHLGARS